MESLLSQCLDSILQTPSLAAVEAVVVNDGSRDASLRIARDYESRYPDTIRVIDKPNGNYGSTINAALPVVRGEYVRILDADDCFDGGLLADYIAFLRRNAGTDMIVSPFIEVRRRSERRVGYDNYSRRLYDYDRRYDMERVFADGAIRFFMMHSVSYRTELLRGMNYRQSEGISYTDQEWVFYPLFKVATVAFADIPLYRYNLAREGQTMDAAVPTAQHRATRAGCSEHGSLFRGGGQVRVCRRYVRLSCARQSGTECVWCCANICSTCPTRLLPMRVSARYIRACGALPTIAA